MGSGHGGLLHRLVANHTGPALHLHDRAAVGAFEEESGARAPANAEAGNPVPLVGKEMLEEHLELWARHGVHRSHAGALICLPLPCSATTQPRNGCADERNSPQHHHSAAVVVQGSPDDEQGRAADGNGPSGVSVQERPGAGLPGGAPAFGTPNRSVRRPRPSRSPPTGVEVAVTPRPIGFRSSRGFPAGAAWWCWGCSTDGLERPIVCCPTTGVGENLVGLLHLAEKGSRAVEVGMDTSDQSAILRLDLVRRGGGRRPQDVVVGVPSHPSTMPLTSMAVVIRFAPLRRVPRLQCPFVGPGPGAGGPGFEPVTVPWVHVATSVPTAVLRRPNVVVGTRPPTEVGARALRFRRPARCTVARVRTSIPPKGACNDFPRPFQGRRPLPRRVRP